MEKMENKERDRLELREVILSEAIPTPVIIALEKLGIWTRKKIVIDEIVERFTKLMVAPYNHI